MNDLDVDVQRDRFSLWSDVIGPVYQTATFAAAGGHLAQDVAIMISERRILSLTTSDNHVVIPVFQFDDELHVLPGVVEVLRILPCEIVDEWTLASWFHTRPEPLGGTSVIRHLAGGGAIAPVLAAVSAARRRWSI